MIEDEDLKKKICFSFAKYCNVFETVVTSKVEFLLTMIIVDTKKDPNKFFGENGSFDVHTDQLTECQYAESL